MNTASGNSGLGIDMMTIYKMTFVYNAVLNGWTVKKLKDTKFEFSNSVV